MQVLFVTAYEPLTGKRKTSITPNEILLRTVKTAFREVRKQFPISSLNMRRDGKDPNNYILRKYNEISDMVVDWHHDNIDDAARKKLKNFDKIDIIIIGGDMKGVLPWDPQAMQAVTLMHMAITAKKPVLAVGFGAFIYIYSLATQGSKYHMLNGPGGDVNPTENLPVFPNFARPTGQYPGGWMDNSSGDVYCYYEDKRLWKPSLNIGIHRYPVKLTPYSPRTASAPAAVATTYMPTTTDSASHAFDFNFNFNYPRPTTAATAMALYEKVLVIRKQMLHHPFLKGVSDVAAGCNSNPRNFSPRGPAPPLTYLTFLMRTYPCWFINSDGGLPAARAGLQVLAECEEGPVILSMDNVSLLLASELEESKSCYPIAYHLVQTFVSHTLTRLIPQHPMVSVPVHPTSRPATGSGGNSSSQQQQQQQQESLFVLLLGSDGWERDVRYDSSKHHGPANLPLSAAAIHTSLPKGPFRIDLPSPSQWVTTPELPEKIDYFALTRDRKHSSLGKEVRVCEQGPQNGRSRRLRALMLSTGYGYGGSGQGVQQKGISFANDSLSSWEEDGSQPSSSSEEVFRQNGGNLTLWANNKGSDGKSRGTTTTTTTTTTTREFKIATPISREIVAIPEVDEDGPLVIMSFIQEEGRSITPFAESTTTTTSDLELGLGLGSVLWDSQEVSSDAIVTTTEDPVIVSSMYDDGKGSGDINSVALISKGDMTSSSLFQSSNEDNNNNNNKSFKPTTNNTNGTIFNSSQRNNNNGDIGVEVGSGYQQKQQQELVNTVTDERTKNTLTLNFPVPPSTSKPSQTYRVIASSKDGKEGLSRFLNQAAVTGHLPVHHPVVSKPRQPKPSSSVPFSPQKTETKVTRGRKLVDFICQPNLGNVQASGEKSLSPFYGLMAYNN